MTVTMVILENSFRENKVLLAEGAVDFLSKVFRKSDFDRKKGDENELNNHNRKRFRAAFATRKAKGLINLTTRGPLKGQFG